MVDNIAHRRQIKVLKCIVLTTCCTLVFAKDRPVVMQIKATSDTKIL